MKFIFWTAFSPQSKYQAIPKLEEIIDRHEGFIVDIKPFSDLSLSLRIELEERNIDALYTGLQKAMELKPFETMDSSSKRERTVFLNITFAKSTGDVRQNIPQV